jgi:hypothetical protein
MISTGVRRSVVTASVVVATVTLRSGRATWRGSFAKKGTQNLVLRLPTTLKTKVLSTLLTIKVT